MVDAVLIVANHRIHSSRVFEGASDGGINPWARPPSASSPVGYDKLALPSKSIPNRLGPIQFFQRRRMPLCTICGLPAAGKTTFAAGLVAFLKEHEPGRRVVLVNEEALHIAKLEGYRGEKGQQQQQQQQQQQRRS